MIYAEELIDHAETLVLDEARWLSERQVSLVELLDSIDEELTSNLRTAITDSVKITKADEFIAYDKTMPTIGSNLLAEAWEDLSTQLVFSDPERMREAEGIKHISVIINKIILPLNGITTNSQEVTSTAEIGEESRIDACLDAEGYFSLAYQQAMMGTYCEHPRLSVYHDKAGKPIAFRKSLDVSSAITLEPINLYGSIVPPGSIVGIDRDENQANQPALTGSVKVGRQLWQTFRIDNNFLIGPKRLSPWAYSRPQDRALFAINEDSDTGLKTVDEDRLELTQEIELDFFRIAARQVMNRCSAEIEKLAA